MKFDDEYAKANDKKTLDEDFIKNLSLKMSEAAKAEQTKPEENPENDFTGIVKHEKDKRTKYISFIAAAAAVTLIFRFTLMQLKPDKPFDTGSEIETSISDSTSAVSDEAQISTGSDETVSGKENTVTDIAVPFENYPGYSENQASVLYAIDTLALDESPLVQDYSALDYADLYSIYNNFEYKDNNKGFELSSDKPNGEMVSQTSAGPYSSYQLDYSQSQCSVSSMTEHDAEQYKRLLDYINGHVGADKYSLYDIYSYSYTRAFSIDEPSDAENPILQTDSSEKNYCIEIVPTDYLNDFKSCTKSDYIVKFEIKNDVCSSNGIFKFNSPEPDTFRLNAVLSSEYEQFIEARPVADALISELTEQFSDCAVYVMDAEIDSGEKPTYTEEYSFLENFYSIYGVNKAQYRFAQSTSESSDDYSHKKMFAYKRSIYPEIITGSVNYVTEKEYYVYPHVFFKPGTSQKEVVEQLNNMLPILNKYNVQYICADILDSDESFKQARENKGYLPDKLIDSARVYYTVSFDTNDNSYVFEGWWDR